MNAYSLKGIHNGIHTKQSIEVKVIRIYYTSSWAKCYTLWQSYIHSSPHMSQGDALEGTIAVSDVFYYVAEGNFPSIECEYTVKDFDDYEQQIRGCNRMQSLTLEEGDTVCYNQIIYDDQRVEPTEYTGLTLLVKKSTAATVVEIGHSVLKIEDNDCKLHQ